MLFLFFGLSGSPIRASEERTQNILAQFAEYAHPDRPWEPLLPRANIYRLQVSAPRAQAELAALQSRPDILFAEFDETVEAFFTPDDPQYPAQWHFEKIGAASAWDFDTTSPVYGGDPSVVVAVIDTGIAYETYNDNGTNYQKMPDFASTAFTAGYDFVNGDTHANDDNGHGTHVAATIAESTNNGIAGAGLAFNATLMPLKVLNRLGTGSVSDVALAITYAVENGADVINLSLGSTSTTQTLVTAVADALNAGIVLVAAAGNDGQGSLGFPSAYPGVISVSALGKDDLLASYSNFGEGLSLSAPGGDDTEYIWQQSYSNLDENRLPNDYTTFDLVGYQGTSQAAPQVAAAAALLLARGVPANGAKTLLEQTATDLGTGTGYDAQNGYGRVNVAAALQAFVNDATPPTTTATLSPSAPNGNDGYYKTKPDITLTATDGATGSGIRTIYYRWGEEGYSEYDLPIAPPEGAVTLTFYSQDISGNAEVPQTLQLFVDSIPPTITVTRPSGTTVRPRFTLSGSVFDDTTGVASFSINGREVFLGTNRSFLTSQSAAPGQYTVTFVAHDNAGSTTTLMKELKVDGGEYLFVAPGKGSGPQVRILRKNGKVLSSFFAFPKTFRGGVSLTTADLDGDDNEEILTAPESSGGPQVRIFSKNGKLLSQFLAFPKAMTGGLRLAAGDMDGDGSEEILVSPSASERPLVRIFSRSGVVLQEFLAFAKEFRGGVSLASCDLNRDGKEEILAAAGPGGGPQVRIFTKSGKLLSQFHAYEPNFLGGVALACGDVNGDDKNEIITAPATNSTADIRIFTKSGKLLSTFTAYKQTYRAGAHVAAGDVNGNGKDDIIVSPSGSGVSEIRAFTKRGKMITKLTVFPKSVSSLNIAAGFAQ